MFAWHAVQRRLGYFDGQILLGPRDEEVPATVPSTAGGGVGPLPHPPKWKTASRRSFEPWTSSLEVIDRDVTKLQEGIPEALSLESALHRRSQIYYQLGHFDGPFFRTASFSGKFEGLLFYFLFFLLGFLFFRAFLSFLRDTSSSFSKNLSLSLPFSSNRATEAP